MQPSLHTLDSPERFLPTGDQKGIQEIRRSYRDQKRRREIKRGARGSQHGQRLLSERRGEKYLADVVSAGANATSLQLYPAKVFEPIRPTAKAPGHVWQGRFKSFLVQHDEHLITVLRYVFQNPVRLGG